MITQRLMGQTLDWKVMNSNPTSGMGDFANPASILGEFGASVRRLVPPGWVSFTL